MSVEKSETQETSSPPAAAQQERMRIALSSYREAVSFYAEYVRMFPSVMCPAAGLKACKR